MTASETTVVEELIAILIMMGSGIMVGVVLIGT